MVEYFPTEQETVVWVLLPVEASRPVARLRIRPQASKAPYRRRKNFAPTSSITALSSVLGSAISQILKHRRTCLDIEFKTANEFGVQSRAEGWSIVTSNCRRSH